jgi:tetratricopeptide (TPR) repeat protein
LGLSASQITNDIIDDLNNWIEPYKNIKISKKEYFRGKKECNEESNEHLLICIRYDLQTNKIKIYPKQNLSKYDIPEIEYKHNSKITKDLCNKLDYNTDEFVFLKSSFELNGSDITISKNRKLISQASAELMYLISFFLASEQLSIGAKHIALDLLNRVEQQTSALSKYENPGRIWVYKAFSNFIKNNFSEAEKSINSAIEYFKRKEPELNKFIEAFESNKQYNRKKISAVIFDDHSEIATTLMMRGTLYALNPNPKYDIALKFIDGSIALDDIPDSWNMKGEVLRALKNYKDAEKAYLKASVETNPFSYRAYYNLGILYLEKSDVHEVGKTIENFNKATEIKKNYKSAFFELGKIYFNMGRTELAITFFDRILQIDKFDSVALSYRAESYRRLDTTDSYSEAIEDYEHLIRLCPKDESTYRDEIKKAKERRSLLLKRKLT